MKVILAQMDVIPGQIEKNLSAMFKQIENRTYPWTNEEVDIIAFPELCVGGYLIGDLWYDPDWIDQLVEANERIIKFIKELKNPPIVIWGNIGRGFPGTTNQDGRPRLFNCAYMAYTNMGADIKVASVAKTLLPNYRFFDDKRYFSSGEGFNVFDVTLPSSRLIAKIGLEVCEDLWHEDYPVNPTSHLVEQGAEYIFNISASPYSFGKGKSRSRIISRTLKDVKTKGNLKYFFYVNCVGAQNNGKNIVTFDGDSAVYDGNGILRQVSSGPFQAMPLHYDTHNERSGEFQPQEFDKEYYQYHSSLVGIKSLDNVMGNDKFPYIIGVSGGVDSAVSLALLVDAVGKDRVKAFNLPTQYNSKATKTTAKKVCEALGVSLQFIPVGDIVDSQIRHLQNAGFVISDVNEENIQAKIRGTTILSNIAGALGGVMVNNGNKLEVALGYATLYGDVNGAIAPLGDLLKVEVWNLARWMNEHQYSRAGKATEVIPWELLPDERFEIPLPPSAELKANQIDPMKWGYHDALLAFLLDYKRGSVKELCEMHKYNRKEFQLMLCHALPDRRFLGSLDYIMEKYDLGSYDVFIKDLNWFLKTMERAVFKRIQSPPIIVQSKSAFGFDYRESQLGTRLRGVV